jgi:hypothetical protein
VDTSAQGIVSKASVFKGIVRPSFIKVLLVDDAGKAVSNVKCEVTFAEGNQTIAIKSDTNGVLKFSRKPEEFTIKLLE